MDNFEKVEYEQCLSLLKYYDDRHLSLVKFAAGISSAVPSVIIAFYKLGNEVTEIYWYLVAFLSVVTAVSLSAVYLGMVQNRLYFMYPVRQVNAIRRAQFRSEDTPLFDNQMYTSVDFSAFKWKSSHTLMNAFVSFQMSLFWGLAVFSMVKNELTVQCAVIAGLGTTIVFSILIFTLSSLYLYHQSKYHPDRSIHGKPGEATE